MDGANVATHVREAFEDLSLRLEAAFEAWAAAPAAWPEERFDAYARECFDLQYAANRPYGRYCRAIGIEPSSVESWREVPPVPTAAFRAVDLIVGDPGDARLAFRTSGTTRGAAARGTHLVRRPATYRAALVGPFRHHVLGGRDHGRLLVLHPAFDPPGDSSLAWMLEALLEDCGDAASARADIENRSETPGWAELEAAVDAGAPVAILGTTLALASWYDRLEADGRKIRLPDGSTIMDTGGAKGRPGLVRDSVVTGLAERLGLLPSALRNEFGMTELLSQRYAAGTGRLVHRGPPWLRSRVLDPVTLTERPAGDDGILCHYDLANAGSVVAVLTEDRGRLADGGIEWLGRTPGAVPRGCSLATAELLEAQA